MIAIGSLAGTAKPPLVVEVSRGATCESRHVVSAVVTRAGEIVATWGDPDAMVFSRSAFKPFQALALLAHGMEPSRGRLALACGSHNGEPVHVEHVRRWLDEIGLSAQDLRCGAHDPIDAPSARALAKQGFAAGPEHNNCSGKHCGFLHLALCLGAEISDYSAYDHPVQRAIRATASDIFALDFDGLPWGTDGCGVPNYATTLADLARAYAVLGSPEILQSALRGSALQVFEAMAAEPYLVAGRKRFDTAAMETMPGQLVVKGGAEGVWAAAMDSGLGLAVKVHDGAKRAAEFAMADLLAKVTGVNALAAHAGRTVVNVAGHKVGDIRWSAEARL